MAEPSASESSPETDREFDPTAEMMVNDFDDERTLEEEEAMESGEDAQNELDDLHKEGDMPIEDLLAIYGYGDGDGQHADNTQSSSSEEILSNQDLTLDKDEIARDLLKDGDHGKETSVNELLDSVDTAVSTSRLLRSAVSHHHHQSESESESEDEDYVPNDDDDWKKTIQVGSDFQAVIPEGLCKYDDAPAYENDDKLLWDPSQLVNQEVEDYLQKAQLPHGNGTQGVIAVPAGCHVRDDEQALYVLLQCGHNIEEALRRRRMQSVMPTDTMSLWSEEECRSFENGLRTYGKDFHLIQLNKVRTRSVGELVQFYYLWKKTERHDVFANKARLEKKKYTLHPGTTDYMDRFLDDQENPTPHRDRSSSPNVNSLISGDYKRQHGRTPPSTPPSHSLPPDGVVVLPTAAFPTPAPEPSAPTTTTTRTIAEPATNGAPMASSTISKPPASENVAPKLTPFDDLARNLTSSLDRNSLESLARLATAGAEYSAAETGNGLLVRNASFAPEHAIGSLKTFDVSSPPSSLGSIANSVLVTTTTATANSIAQ